MINRRLLIIIAALILAPLLWWGFGGKIKIEEVKAAVTCSSFPCYIDYNQMQFQSCAWDGHSSYAQGIRDVHSGGKCDPCCLNGVCAPNTTPCCQTNTDRNDECDHSWYRDPASSSLVAWNCETIPVKPASNLGCYAYGQFDGLISTVTYRAWLRACYNQYTGVPDPKGGRIAYKRSDWGSWTVFDLAACGSPGEWIDLGTFNGQNSIRIQVQSRPLGGRSDRWIRQMRLDAETCGAWGSTIAEPPACDQANGLRGRYYRDNPIGGADFAARSDGGLKLVRNDSTVNFDWGANSSPDMAKLECDHFTVVWTGWVNLSTSGNWTFYTWTDDGARLWVDGVQLVDKWQDQGPTEWSGTINRNADWYSIRFEYYENGGGAVARLSYSNIPQGIGKQIIPAANLRSCDAPQGPALTCRFTEISPGILPVGSGTQPDPYKIQRGTEWIKIETTAATDDPGGGTMDFKLVYPGGAKGTIRDNVPYGAGGIWQETWNDADPAPPVGLPEDNGYRVRSHFDGFGTWDVSDGNCYFNIVPPANAEYIISARGDISNLTKSFCWGQGSGCLLPYYPAGLSEYMAGRNPPITAPTYDELRARFGPGTLKINFGDFDAVGTIAGSGVYRIDSGYSVDGEFTFAGGRNYIIFISGTLTVKAEIHIPTNSAVVFIARSILFRKNLIGGDSSPTVQKDETDGFYIAAGLVDGERDINTAYDFLTGDTTRRLVVSGALISTKGTVVLWRNLPDTGDVTNARYASEQIKLDPKYYVLVAPYLGEAQVSWREVAP